MNIGNVSTWFLNNNQLVESSDYRLRLLVLYTKIACMVLDEKMDFLEEVDINLENKTIAFKMEYDLEEENFSKMQLFILRTINRSYGYLKDDDIWKLISYVKGDYTIDNIFKCIKDYVSFELYSNKDKNLDVDVYMFNGNVFFVQKGVKLKDSDIKMLKEFESFTYIEGTNELEYLFDIYYDQTTKKIRIW